MASSSWAVLWAVTRGCSPQSNSWTLTSSGGGKRLTTQVTNSALPSGEPYSSPIILPDS